MEEQYDVRSYTPFTFNSAKVQCITNYGISKRKKCDDDIRKASKFKVQILETDISG